MFIGEFPVFYQSFIIYFRLVLVASSQHFRAKFLDGLCDSNEQSMTMSDTSADILSKLLDFVYFGATIIGRDSLVHLLVLADKFCFYELAECCVKSFKASLCIENCLDTLEIGNMLNSDSLLGECSAFIRSHFLDVSL